MIGFLSGKLRFVRGSQVIVDCNGVGYKVEVANQAFLEGNDVELFIHTFVREQDLRLFGFESAKELDVFEALLGVSGVGPKAAMSLISNLGTQRILDALQQQNPVALKVSGVGIKTAQKIVLELKDKIDRGSDGEVANMSLNPLFEDAITALENLGYKRFEIQNVITKVKVQEGWESEDIIKVLLKYLAVHK